MSLLTDKEILEMAHDGVFLQSIYEITRDIEAMIIEKIKTQGAEAWLHRDRPESDVVTTKFKHVWGEAVVGSLAMYDIPLYRLPEGD